MDFHGFQGTSKAKGFEGLYLIPWDFEYCINFNKVLNDNIFKDVSRDFINFKGFHRILKGVGYSQKL